MLWSCAHPHIQFNPVVFGVFPVSLLAHPPSQTCGLINQPLDFSLQFFDHLVLFPHHLQQGPRIELLGVFLNEQSNLMLFVFQFLRLFMADLPGGGGDEFVNKKTFSVGERLLEELLRYIRISLHSGFTICYSLMLKSSVPRSTMLSPLCCKSCKEICMASNLLVLLLPLANESPSTEISD